MTRRRLDIRDLRVLSLSVVFIFALLVSGCDDDPAEPGDFNSGELAIIPSSATVPAGGVQDFDAELGGERVGSAQWRIVSDVAVGSITQDGTYTAPDQVDAQFSFEIEAEVPTVTAPATATVTVVP